MYRDFRWMRHALVLLLTVALSGLAGPALAQDPGSIVGTVVDGQDGTSLVGANVALRVAGQPDIVDGTATDPDGAFRLTGLDPNQYVVEVRFVGYQANQRTVTVEAGETVNLTIELALETSSLETVVVSASRRQEKALNAPASISVLEPEELQSSVQTSSVEAIRATPGVDMAQTGIDRREVVLRGFNDAFNGSAYILTDYRESAVPSLGVNVFSIMPNMPIDLARVEVVRGPGSALYGPGVDSGVVHFFTKDPFQYPGTTIAVSGGSREYFAGQFRNAGTISDNLGYKITGQYARAEEWNLDPNDPEDAREIERYFTYDERSDVPDGRTVVPVPGEDDETDFQLRREDVYQKYNVNGLLQYETGDATTISLNGGYSRLKGTVQSGIGTLQAEGFGYTYGQVRVRSGALFSQLYVNVNDSGAETFVYGTGQPVRDRGIQWNFQSQYDFDLSQIGTQLITGIDADVVTPRTGGRIVGRNEDDDRIQAYGAYAQSSTDLNDQFALTLALRGDYNNVVDDVQLSPRAALVFKATPSNTFRGSYNRSFSTPGTNSLFLDIQAQTTSLGNDRALVFQGLGAADGYTFNNFRQDGTVAFSLPVPGFFGSNDFAASQLPIAPMYLAVGSGALTEEQGAVQFTDGVSASLSAQGISSQQQELLAQLFGYTVSDPGRLLSTFLPVQDGGAPTNRTGAVELGIPDDSENGYSVVDGPVDIPALRQTTTQTFEVGYKGFYGSKVLFTIDAYYERKENFIGALSIESPLAYLQGMGLASDVGTSLGQLFATTNDATIQQILQGLQNAGLSPAQTAAVLGGIVGNGLNNTPTGVVQPDQTLLTDQDFAELEAQGFSDAVGGFLSYRNFGQVEYWGIDASLQVQATDELSTFANVSIVSDDFFNNEELNEADESLSLALNAPSFKLKGGFDYRFLETGLSFGSSANYVEGFPVQSGPYVGTVDNYFLLDARVSYKVPSVPGLQATLSVNNVLNNEHRQFVGAPELGRLFIGRLQYTVGGN